MTVDKRSVTTDALETLGTIIGEGEKRDAIHLAVNPAIAAETLYPGQHVGFVDGGVGPCKDTVGIVDPFLAHPVMSGQRFWLVVYPRQITSLRHVWTHPAFDDALGDAVETMVDQQRAASEAWLRNFCKISDCPSYEEVIGVAVAHADGDVLDTEFLHFQDRDAHGTIPPEFWDHLEVVTGVKVSEEDRATSFSCAC